MGKNPNLSSQNVCQLYTIPIMAARRGLEPRLKEPESFVLPLHHRAIIPYHENSQPNESTDK